MTDAEFEAELDHLFSSPPEEFVAARIALVRKLKSEGRGDDIGAVKALRRPSRPLSALNRAALTAGGAVRDVVEAANRVSEIQSSGGDGLRDAITELRSASHAATDAAVRAIDAARPSDRAEVSTALLAVLAQPEALARLARGRLVDLPDAGFGAFGEADARPTTGAAPTKSSPRRTSRKGPSASDRKTVAKERARARSAVAGAEKAQARAVAEAEGADEALDQARARLDRARAELTEAEASAEIASTAADAARSRVAAAAEDLATAQASLEALAEGP